MTDEQAKAITQAIDNLCYAVTIGAFIVFAAISTAVIIVARNL